jgi:hypothetical protein
MDSERTVATVLATTFAGRGRPLVIEARVDTAQYSAQF